MPFVALDKNTKERIDITKIANPRLTLRKGELICQDCQVPMIIRAGPIRRHHFSHYTGECSSDIKKHPQSPEHLGTKDLVAEKAREWFSEFTYAEPDFEVRIPEVNRQADVLFTFPNGWRIACEVQLASITTEELQQRTDDYLRAGIDTLWFLGKSACSPANVRWSIETFGFAIELSYSTNQVRAQLTTEPLQL